MAGAGARTIVDTIDPDTLVVGTNRVTLCAPAEAKEPVRIAKLRLVGELDRGVAQPDEITVGSADGDALLDGDASTTVEIAAGQRVAVAFARTIAPDALVLTGEVAQAPSVECVERTNRKSVV